MDGDLTKCFETAQLNGLTLRNRLIKAATFEGKTPGGVPGAPMRAFHRRFGEGGVGMTNRIGDGQLIGIPNTRNNHAYTWLGHTPP